MIMLFRINFKLLLILVAIALINIYFIKRRNRKYQESDEMEELINIAYNAGNNLPVMDIFSDIYKEESDDSEDDDKDSSTDIEELLNLSEKELYKVTNTEPALLFLSHFAVCTSTEGTADKIIILNTHDKDEIVRNEALLYRYAWKEGNVLSESNPIEAAKCWNAEIFTLYNYSICLITNENDVIKDALVKAIKDSHSNQEQEPESE